MKTDRYFYIAPPGWRIPLPAHFLGIALASLIAGGLYIDAHFGVLGQWLTNCLVSGAMLALIWNGDTLLRIRLSLCIAIAILGEVLLSLGWGLYEYWHHNVPIFVPPGHAVLLLLGMLLASRGVARWFCWLTWIVATFYALYATISGYATFELVALGMYCICMYFGRSKALYTVMFWLTIAMELYGTALGNWRWAAVEPLFGLTNTNPPLLVGAAYCVLDALVLVCTRRIVRKKSAMLDGQASAA